MWRVYYDDGTVLSRLQDINSDQTRKTGVIAVAQPDKDHNWYFWFGPGKDFYLLDIHDQWIAVDTFGFVDYMLHKIEHVVCVLQGRTVGPQEYRTCKERMMEECQPAKTGWQADEWK